MGVKGSFGPLCRVLVICRRYRQGDMRPMVTHLQKLRPNQRQATGATYRVYGLSPVLVSPPTADLPGSVGQSGRLDVARRRLWIVIVRCCLRLVAAGQTFNTPPPSSPRWEGRPIF